ncbi:MAG: AAA family ATPase [Candidatus Paceibacterota bacterium]
MRSLSLGFLKSTLKDFAMNRLLPILPVWALCWIFDNIMLPKAEADRKLVDKAFATLVANEVILQVPAFSRRTTGPLVVAMVGLPQSGKTTAARILARRAELSHINSNDVRGWLIDAGSNYANINALVLYFMVCRLESGLNVVMDSDHMLPGKRAFVEALAKRAGAQVEFVSIEVEKTLLLQRMYSLENFHRLYHDGFRRHDPSFQDKTVSIPIHTIRTCVCGEIARQAPGHVKYGAGLKSFASLSNNDTKEILILEAEHVARRLLMTYGNQCTKESVRQDVIGEMKAW